MSEGLSPSSEWVELGQDPTTYYKNEEFYDMLWEDIDLNQYIVSCARYGGPIATVRDDKKIVLVGAKVRAYLFPTHWSC